MTTAGIARLLAVALLVWPAVTDAQAPAIELAADERAVELLDVDAIASSLGAELETPVEVVVLDAARAADATRLTIRGRGPRRVSLELIAGGRSPLRRSTRLTADREDRTATIVILAANMVRDEAGEIVAMLRRRREAQTPVESVVAEATVESEVATDSAVESESEIESESESEVESETEVESESEVEPAPAPAPAPEPTPEIEPAPERAPVDPFLRLGLTGQFSSVPRTASQFDFAYLAGLEISATPLPFLAIGIRDLGGALATNQRWNVGGAPFVELAWRIADFLDLHGGIGAHVQYLAGAGIADAFGVAPLVYLGLRFYLAPIFSISIEPAVRYVATDSFHTGLSVIPQGAVFLSAGLALTFHLPN